MSLGKLSQTVHDLVWVEKTSRGRDIMEGQKAYRRCVQDLFCQRMHQAILIPGDGRDGTNKQTNKQKTDFSILCSMVSLNDLLNVDVHLRLSLPVFVLVFVFRFATNMFKL